VTHPQPLPASFAAIQGALAAARVPQRYRVALLEELAAHAHSRVEILTADGLAPEEAWIRAVAELGPPDVLAADARAASNHWRYRAPAATFVLGPALIYGLLAFGLVPLVLDRVIGLEMVGSALGPVVWAIRASAAVGAVVCIYALLQSAQASPGLWSSGLMGSAVIALLCGLLHPSATAGPAGHTLRIVFEPSTQVWQMTPALALLVARWRSRRLV
jgi:hypothetical protein